MTWVRYDDHAAWHPKLAPLDDGTFRLWFNAMGWCSSNLTDGRIAAEHLTSIPRATKARAQKLVARKLWHEAGHQCDSLQCPPAGDDGWVIHDYFEYQPSRAKVKADLAAKAERTRKWRAKASSRPAGAAARDASRDASPGDASPPRPEGGGAAGTAKRRSTPRRCPDCGNAMTSAYHRNTCRSERLGGAA